MKTNRSDEGLTTDSNSCTRKKNLSEVFPTPNVWLSSSVYNYGAQLVSGRHEFEPEPMGSKPDFFKTPFYSDKIAVHLRGSFLCLTLSRVHGFTWFGLRCQHRVLTLSRSTPLPFLPTTIPGRRIHWLKLQVWCLNSNDFGQTGLCENHEAYWSAN